MTDTLVDPRRSTVAPCEQALRDADDTPPDCDVCDDTGEVLDAPGRGGRKVMPCLSCDAYDRETTRALERLAELMGED